MPMTSGLGFAFSSTQGSSVVAMDGVFIGVLRLDWLGEFLYGDRMAVSAF